MALFDLNPVSSWFGGWFGRRTPAEVTDAIPASALVPNGKPRTAGQQSAGASSVSIVPPGYPAAPAGDYDVWRAMDADPALTLSRAVITAPIREADKSYEAREGTPDEWVNVVQSAIDPLWTEYVREALDALSMGWKPFEGVFGRREGRTVLTDLPPLAQEVTTALVKDGGFVGLRNHRGRGGKTVDLFGPHALVFTVDGKNRNPYGRPWHENSRDAWWGKLQDFASLAKLNRKASGIQGKAYYPHAENELTEHTNENKAKTVLKEYMEGNGAVLPNATGLLDPSTAADYRNIKGMAENALWSLIIEDHGNNGPQAMALLEQIKARNADLSRGWHVPERAAQQGEHGTNAESETQSQINQAMSQLVYNDLCLAMTRGPVDTILVENYGDRARGAVTIKAGKLRDIFAAGDWRLIDAVLRQADLFMAVAEQVDLDAVFTRRGIPKLKGVLTLTESVKQVNAQRAEKREAEAAALATRPVVPPMNGNGKAAVELARGAAWLGRMLEEGHDE